MSARKKVPGSATKRKPQQEDDSFVRKRIDEEEEDKSGQGHKQPSKEKKESKTKKPSEKRKAIDEEEEDEEEEEQQGDGAGDAADAEPEDDSVSRGAGALSAAAVEKDAPELAHVLQGLVTQVDSVKQHASKLHAQLEQGSLPTSKGVSFLEMKHQLLQSYNTNLALYMLLKAEGKQIQGHPVVKRLVYLRTVLEKIKPVDVKLKYQIDKLVRLGSGADGAGEDGEDPLRFRPNPDALMPKLAGAGRDGDEDEAAGSEEDEEEQQGVLSSEAYRPPRIASMPYDHDDTAAAKKEKQDAKLRRQLGRSRMIQDLRNELSDKPLEISEREAGDLDVVRGSMGKTEAQRRKYEEDMFLRLNVSKKQKRKERMAVSRLEDITDFGGFKNYEDGADNKLVDVVKKKSMREQISKVKNTNFGTKQHLRPTKRARSGNM